MNDRHSLSDWAIWSMVEQSAKQIGIRRSRPAKSLRQALSKAGGELEQIKFLPGHSSIQTTKRYLGPKQEIAIAVNDNRGIWGGLHGRAGT